MGGCPSPLLPQSAAHPCCWVPGAGESPQATANSTYPPVLPHAAAVSELIFEPLIERIKQSGGKIRVGACVRSGCFAEGPDQRSSTTSLAALAAHIPLPPPGA